MGCTIMYYVDPVTGHIYAANNEDYYFDVDAYVMINPAKPDRLAHLWYGWDDFGQGGVNQAGLFIDGAVTPKTEIDSKYKAHKGNFTEEILATCKTVNDVLRYFDEKNFGLSNAHVLIGDSTGRAVVVEWMGKDRIEHYIQNGILVTTNFLLNDHDAGGYPCPRFESASNKLAALSTSDRPTTLLEFGNCIAGSVQPEANINGNKGGTLYSTFIDITNMRMVLSYKLSNENILKLDLNEAFASKKSRKIRLDKL